MKIHKTPEKLFVQAYNGARVMSGPNKGIQVRVKAKHNRHPLIHCYAYQLNHIV